MWLHCKDCNGQYKGEDKDDANNWCGWSNDAVKHTKETGHRNFWNWVFD
jgi:hypothetical protein